MINQAQRSQTMRFTVALGFPASQLQSTGHIGMLRPLSSFPTCLHFSSSTAWDWPPPSRKTSMVLTSAASSPAHSKRYENQIRLTVTVMFEPLKLSPGVTSLKNQQHTISLLSQWPLWAKKSLLWNHSTFIPIRSNGFSKLPEEASLDPYFSLSPIITLQMFLLFLYKEGIFEEKNSKRELFLD